MELQYSMQIKAVKYAIEYIDKEIKEIKGGMSENMDAGYKSLLKNRLKSLESERESFSKYLEENDTY